MKLISGDYKLSFHEGGVEVYKNNNLLYYNRRPIFVTVKTVLAISEFYDSIYSEIIENEDGIYAKGTLTVPSGSEWIVNSNLDNFFKGIDLVFGRSQII